MIVRFIHLFYLFIFNELLGRGDSNSFTLWLSEELLIGYALGRAN